MAKRRKMVVEEKRVSRSKKKTPYCNKDKSCPSCGTMPTDSLDYESLGDDGQVVFFYRCKNCGQTFRREINVRDI